METQIAAHTLQYVEDLWDNAVAEGLDPVERLVYRSNLLGSDWHITHTGGGNTSSNSKLIDQDLITGKPVEGLWVKGSGGDLRTAKGVMLGGHGLINWDDDKECYPLMLRLIDKAEAIFLLVSDRLGKTTGQVISVDGGLRDAFLR